MKELIISVWVALFCYMVLSLGPIKSRLSAISGNNPDIPSSPMPFTVRDNGEVERLLRIEQEKEKERIRQQVIQQERKRSDFLLNWKTLLKCDYMGGRWYNSWLQGGGFKDVNIMFYNNSEYTVDEVSVRFRVKMRNFSTVCHDRTHTFYNVLPNTAKSISVSNDCGMRPPKIGIVSIRVKEIEIEQSNNWDDVSLEEFHD
jgi:hypothetical protein